MNVYEAIMALHQSVRAAIEQQLDCHVTSIEATTETRYAPTKETKYVMKEATILFEVEARQGFAVMRHKVAVDSNGQPRILSTEMRMG